MLLATGADAAGGPLTGAPAGNNAAQRLRVASHGVPTAMAKPSAGQWRRLLEIGGLILGHVAAVAIGFVMMVVGLGLGVTIIMLPIGLAIGLVGVGIFVWGLLGHLGNNE